MVRKKQIDKESAYLAGFEINEHELRNVITALEIKLEERKMINEDITSIIKDAESLGFNTKVLREVVRLRSMDLNKRLTLDNLLPHYLKAVEQPCGPISLSLLYVDNDNRQVAANGEIPASSRSDNSKECR